MSNDLPDVPTEAQIQEYARRQCKTAIRKLAGIIKYELSRPGDVIAATKVVLLYGYGQPWLIQSVSQDNRNAHQMTNAELWELARLSDRYRTRGRNGARSGNGSTPPDRLH